ncbi:hypothetical protein VSS37_02070 [Candidatus Thiothrix sp. Deng01]|uniref:DUF4388 domain-containing protein n=1 Tax=Candidatus Thiothrix phosphatis TaxID=3112415 RepID=A0ABU6CTA0_9GAMM|nr:hypothetical protein [Candidatus Thiothrix sp. Deng01]MEB4589757.1 hypothetical protein [Candidatus Thiothrix sp. Deng01]
MERHSQFTLSEIMDKLAHILAHKQTGTFFIATDANTSCRFAIDSGKITHCAHKRDHGVAALLSLQEISGGSCSFSENQSIPFRQESIVDHQTCLDILNLRPVIPAKSAPAPEAPASSSPAPLVKQAPPARYYRGQTSAPEQEETPTAATSEPAKQPPAAPTRYYRGQPIPQEEKPAATEPSRQAAPTPASTPNAPPKRFYRGA